MKALKIITIVCLAFILSGKVNAQKVQLVSGDLDFLQGQTTIKVKYDYENMAVGKYDKEEDYVSFMVNEKNNSEPGSGDKWQEAWFSDRINRFQPKFEETMNKQFKKYNLSFSTDFEDAKYTMILKTTFIEIDFKKPMIAVEVLFYKAVNPNNIVAKIIIPKTITTGFTTGVRFENAYMLCGKSLAKFLTKNAF